ncbi:dienelactone hydrolase family protein [Mycobacterium sp. AZCC_0083]|uniref:dienelactone hydrolase family protein n=1 Tax=Mycobacterium sp. AZCC_0083 TaxID=2735882 RepID=UPI00161F30C2|nr:dienelactone hydrolase family protein [Mycobacterium sp. AZCC_0083]MBB5164362.1 dienelactone hydrolase [Mycobacterium sp. AZCC_0083]
MATLTTLPFDYEHAGLDFGGVLVSGERPNAPAVLVFHGMEGRSDAQVEFCHLLAELGYRAVAVDLFGRAVTEAGPDACAAAMDAFLKDRRALRDRIIGVVDTIRDLSGIDADAMAAIGFCFGGLCVLDAARHGVKLRAVGAFHGLLTPLPEPSDAPIHPKIAVYHGWADPLAPPADVVALAAELTERGADWQLHAYGHAMHAFMATFANAPERGIQHDEKTYRRAWASLVDFLDETFPV